VSLELLVFQHQDDATSERSKYPRWAFQERGKEQMNLGLPYLDAKAYATVGESRYPSLGAAYGKELMPIDGEVNRKVV
jgi:hypothetical protein